VVGEPIEPEVWRWYHSEVGKGQAAIVDTWWQTETGGFLGSGLPAIKPMKPGSCGPMALGIYAVIYDEDGNEVLDGNAGNICIRNPWPGIFETIWGQPERFVDTYYAKYNKDPDSTSRDVGGGLRCPRGRCRAAVDRANGPGVSRRPKGGRGASAS
jgi:acetyl-CoA synthetase